MFTEKRQILKLPFSLKRRFIKCLHPDVLQQICNKTAVFRFCYVINNQIYDCSKT